MSWHKLKPKTDGDKINVQEDHIGNATSEICYPRIQSCISLTVVTAHGLTGAHITVSTEDSIIDEILAKMATRIPSVAYVVGGIQHFKGKTKDSRFTTRKGMKSTMKKLMPGLSKVYFFDTWQHSQDVNLRASLNSNFVDFAWEQGRPVDWNIAPDMSNYTPIAANQLVQR